MGWRAFTILATSPERGLRVSRIYINVQGPQVPKISKNHFKFPNHWSGAYLITLIENHDPRGFGSNGNQKVFQIVRRADV